LLASSAQLTRGARDLDQQIKIHSELRIPVKAVNKTFEINVAAVDCAG
jgi:hypothetical protein